MSILRTIYCNVKSCNMEYKEKAYGAGFPGWGILTGKVNEKGDEQFGLCPEHLQRVFKFIEEEL